MYLKHKTRRRKTILVIITVLFLALMMFNCGLTGCWSKECWEETKPPSTPYPTLTPDYRNSSNVPEQTLP